MVRPLDVVVLSTPALRNRTHTWRHEGRLWRVVAYFEISFTPASAGGPSPNPSRREGDSEWLLPEGGGG